MKLITVIHRQIKIAYFSKGGQKNYANRIESFETHKISKEKEG